MKTGLVPITRERLNIKLGLVQSALQTTSPGTNIFQLQDLIAISEKLIVPVTRPWLNIFPSYFIFRYSFGSYIASYQYLPAKIKKDVLGLGADGR